MRRAGIVNDYLSVPQRIVFNQPSRFRSLVTGRRFGKSFLGVDELIKFATHPLCTLGWGPDFDNLTGMGMKVWYVAPTYGMAKDIVWSVLLDRLDQLDFTYNIDKSDLSVEFPEHDGSIIGLRGASNYDSLRGRGLNAVLIDEFPTIEKEAWTEVLRPALSDRRGHALFTGSPMGFNWGYDIYRRGLDGVPGWFSWQFTTLDGGFVTAEEIEQAKAELDERVFRQEYMASFETYGGAIYYNFSREPGGTVIDPSPIKGPAIHVGMDFNVNPMTAVIAEVTKNQGFIRDEIRIYGSDTNEMCQEIKNRYPEKRVIVYPDPAAKARHTSSPGGVTDLSIIESFGFIVMVRGRHTLVRDRINAVNSKLKNAKGQRNLFVGRNCKYVIECLERQCYKEETSIPDKEGGLDHGADAVGYFVDFLWPVIDARPMIVEV